MTFVVKSVHPSNQCPGSNASIRQLMADGGKHNPEIAQKLGIKMIATYVLPTEHEAIGIVEADRIEAVQEYVLQSRLMQWNTVTIHPTWTLEEAMGKTGTLPPLY